ncbi:MAG: transglycosylase SLT domain-containing protein [Holosporaceae bacterium]|nr:transglycosylase SLT domain-containing protein [Holosporaceae bacterium]
MKLKGCFVCCGRVVFVVGLLLCCLSGIGINKTIVPTPREQYFSPHELCESEIINAERKYRIPNRLLMAIGTVESGRSLNSKAKRAWPWTVCAAGRSYYFSTKSAAIATVKKLIGRGIKNIDVGCMQVNLLHHSGAFKSLEEAFTPKNNVSYAAKFFMELKNAYNSWTHAVGYYHSKVARYYKPYCSVVYSTWKRVLNHKVDMSPRVQLASSQVKSYVRFLPSYYSLIDAKISAKLHQLGRKTLVRSAPKFFTDEKTPPPAPGNDGLDSL